MKVFKLELLRDALKKAQAQAIRNDQPYALVKHIQENLDDMTRETYTLAVDCFADDYVTRDIPSYRLEITSLTRQAIACESFHFVADRVCFFPVDGVTVYRRRDDTLWVSEDDAAIFMQ